MLANAELCIMFCLCEHETAVCTPGFCLHACVCFCKICQHSWENQRYLAFVRAFVHIRNTEWVCTRLCLNAELLSHPLPKESLANADTVIRKQDKASAVCTPFWGIP